MRYAALLRGINVGGHRKVAMADLRVLLTSLGYAEVETYLQSGNALFTGEEGDPAALEREIEAATARDLLPGVRVLVRTHADLARVVAGNPFPHAAAEEGAKVHVCFLSGEPDEDLLAALDPAQLAPDELRPGERAVYLWYPDGQGRSKLTNDLLERRLGLVGTTRNWNTVLRLHAGTAE